MAGEVEWVDLDEGNKVAGRFTVVDGNLVQIDKPVSTTGHFARRLLDAFLPAGFPHTVTSDYLKYQLFDSLQAFSSSIAGLLASRAVLEGLGVGDAASDATGALIVTIIQESVSRLACILFAHRFGQAIEPECKKYRFLADIFNDTALCLDLLAPVFPFWPKVFVMSTASVLRALCGVAAGASKATLSAHFAKNGNLAELNAKEASQETVISLLGMIAGTVLVHFVHGPILVWLWMTFLVSVHLYLNYCAVRAVEMDTLNSQRATLLYRTFCETGKRPESVPSPANLARVESVLWDSSRTGLKAGILGYPIFASGVSDFVSRGGSAASRALTLASGLASEADQGFISVPDRATGSAIILLEEGLDGFGIAEAFFLHLYVGNSKKDDDDIYRITQSEMQDFKKGMLEVGWRFDPVSLLTTSTARIGRRAGVQEDERAPVTHLPSQDARLPAYD